MTVLAIDTSASLCAAAVFDGERELGRDVLDLGKGHAEHLMDVIQRALDAARIGYTDLTAIAVSIGPGSFTGVRVGVATARGLALALKIPAIGISTLEAVAAEIRPRHPDRAIMAAFASARGEVQAAIYDPFAKLLYDPAIMSADQAARLAADHDAIVAGSAALAIAGADASLVVDGDAVTADIATYARLAATRPLSGEKPKPLYLRQPDAKPQAGFVLPRATP